MSFLLERRLSSLLFFGLFFCFITSTYAQPQVENVAAIKEQPLRIAVAANFAPTLKKLLNRYDQKQGRFPQPIVISASSGALFLQIQHNAPFDFYLSAYS